MSFMMSGSSTIVKDRMWMLPCVNALFAVSTNSTMSSIGGFSFVYFLIWTVFVIASSSSIFIKGEGVIKRFCGCMSEWIVGSVM